MDAGNFQKKVIILQGEYNDGVNPPVWKNIQINVDGSLKTVNTTPLWDDIRFPAFGQRLDTAGGRLDYNYAELGIDYQNTALYQQADQLGMICQLQHGWIIGSDIHPHIHWIQNQDETPNWLLEYRVYKSGETVPATWNAVKYTQNELTYVSGNLSQLTIFPMIDMSGYTLDTDLSIIIDFKLYRDTTNVSTLFDGADPYVGDALLKEFDVHYQRDVLGSKLEYMK